MKRNIISMMLVFIVLLSGCNHRDFPDESLSENNIQTYPALLSVTWYKDCYSESAYVQLYRLRFSQSDYYDNREMQEAAKQINVHYPIDSTSEIELYSWELYNAALEMGLITEDMAPCRAASFSDGIWVLSFSALDSTLTYYDGSTATVLFSDVDGHIIHFTPETLHFP